MIMNNYILHSYVLSVYACQRSQPHSNPGLARDYYGVMYVALGISCFLVAAVSLISES